MGKLFSIIAAQQDGLIQDSRRSAIISGGGQSVRFPLSKLCLKASSVADGIRFGLLTPEN
jgi:hypothetical protein